MAIFRGMQTRLVMGSQWGRWLVGGVCGVFLLVAASAQPIVAAASDLRYPLEEVARAFEKQTGQAVRLSFGSSGAYFTQIRQGAPFALFMSADEAYVEALHAQGLTRDAGELYAIGRLALLAAHGSALSVDAALVGLAERLRRGELRRFAIANPAHAPYGRRAEEALRHAGLWAAIGPHLVLGENVSQAAQFALSGAADGGVVALSLAISPQMSRLGRHALIPETWHTPLRQRMVLLKAADAGAESFYRYLQTPPARAVMRRYGFRLPGETP